MGRIVLPCLASGGIILPVGASLNLSLSFFILFFQDRGKHYVTSSRRLGSVLISVILSALWERVFEQTVSKIHSF